ncbi:recombinase family protein [Metabacillus sp. cB07]|uniref:recombinase family protein n=1 Tax=Metabacillus sp. cB07 TaxID=2806989 RepID=UPI0019399C7E|nr:recombinase family protein [Metabacillus sp. cB07]
MKIGYARVSTADQSLDLQLDALEEFGCEEIFQEKQSGAKDDRKELALALRNLRAGDTFVVYKLDRLARSTKRLIDISDLLKEKNVEFVSIQDNLDTGTAAGKAMFGMLSVLAEFERDIIRERTMAGLQAARARGRMGGRPKVNEKKLNHALALYKSESMSIREIENATGVSGSTLYRALAKVKLHNKAGDIV